MSKEPLRSSSAANCPPESVLGRRRCPDTTCSTESAHKRLRLDPTGESTSPPPPARKSNSLLQCLPDLGHLDDNCSIWDEKEQINVAVVPELPDLEEVESKEVAQPVVDANQILAALGPKINNQIIVKHFDTNSGQLLLNYQNSSTSAADVLIITLSASGPDLTLKCLDKRSSKEGKCGKSWCKGLKLGVVHGILREIFEVSFEVLSCAPWKYRKGAQSLLLELLQMKDDTMDSRDFAMATGKLKEIIPQLQQLDATTISLEHFMEMETPNEYQLEFIELLKQEVVVFVTFLRIIWSFFCLKLCECMDLDVLDKYVNICFMHWYKKRDILWNTVWEQIQKVKECVELSAKCKIDTFIAETLVAVKEIFISNMRTIVISELYETRDWSGIGVTRYQIFSFGGACIQKLFRWVYSSRRKAETKQKYLPYIKYLCIANADRSAVDQRWIDENRGGLRELNAMFFEVTKDILNSGLTAINKHLSMSNRLELEQIIMDIVDDEERELSFQIAYQMRGADDGILKHIYKMYASSLLTKLFSAALRVDKYHSLHIQFRTALKSFHLQGMARHQRDPLCSK